MGLADESGDHVSTSLLEFLRFEVVRDAEPDVLAGAESMNRDVRWVHSSEIFEIAPLLSGEELLLTTGLGLAGRDSAAQRRYIRDLALRGVSGVAIEVGRTFESVPAEMIDEARKYKLPLIVFNKVVPFIRISEVVNTSLVNYSTRSLQLGDQVDRALNESLLAGASLSSLLETASLIAGVPLVLASPNDVLIASHGVDGVSRSHDILKAPLVEVEVSLHGARWARLLAGGTSPLSGTDLRRTMERTAVGIALAGLRDGEGIQLQRDLQASRLLSELVTGKAIGHTDVVLRARMAGLYYQPDNSLVAVAMRVPNGQAAGAVIEGAARLLGTGPLYGNVGQHVMAILVVNARQIDPVGITEHVLNESLVRLGLTDVVIGVGQHVSGASGLTMMSQSLCEARETVDLIGDVCSYLGRPFGAVTASRDVALERSLRANLDADQLAALARSMLGPVIDWDLAHGSDLVRTAEVHIRNGNSPTKTAAELWIRRQATYQRIARIETLLGRSLGSAELHPGLLMAACAWRLSRRRDGTAKVGHTALG